MDQFISNIKQSLPSLPTSNNQIPNQTLLQQQQANQQKINQLLEQSSQALLCGPTCQKLKVSEELKQKYLDAQTNLQIAPIKLEETKKNYYVYTEGQTYYNNIQEEELKKKANELSQSLEESFNNEVSNANTMNSYLNTALINSENTKELLKQYLEKNQILKLSLREKHGDILTNDRKTYYENSALERLSLWYKFFWYIYYIGILILILALIFSPSNLNWLKKSIIIIIFIFYPYYISYIVNWFKQIWDKIVENIPKNVYNNL